MKTIYIVDDTDFFLGTFKMLLNKALKSHGSGDVEVKTLLIRNKSSFDELFDAVRNGEVVGVITDFEMPAIKGNALCATLRERAPTLPLYLHSGNKHKIRDSDVVCEDKLQFRHNVDAFLKEVIAHVASLKPVDAPSPSP